jgi:sugar lactone lactonase YvrE
LSAWARYLYGFNWQGVVFEAGAGADQGIMFDSSNRWARSLRVVAESRRAHKIVLLIGSATTSSLFAQMQIVPSILTIAGNGTQGFAGNGGQGLSAEFSTPNRITVDAVGNVYICDNHNYLIRKYTTSTGIVTTVAGTGTAGFSGDGGLATSAEINPNGIAVDAAGNLYIADAGNNRIRKVTATTGIITTIAGNGTAGYSGDNGQATSAEINSPAGVRLDPTATHLYIADTQNNRVRQVTLATGVIVTGAGNGTSGYSGNGGYSTSAELSQPAGLAFDAAGDLYIADYGNQVVREVNASSYDISTVAGTGVCGYSGNGGAATSAKLCEPSGVSFDAAGNLYIADSGNSVIRMVTPGGTISTYAGTGTQGYTGNGGLASAAELDNASDVAVDFMGNVYIDDVGNNVIRRAGPNTLFVSAGLGTSGVVQKVLLQTTASETLSSFAAPASLGSEQEFSVGTITGCTVNGSTSNASGTVCSVPITFTPAYPGQRNVPLQVVTGSGGVSFGLSGTGNGPLAVLSPGAISTVGGNATAGYTGDGGLATSAELDQPIAITVDAAGNMYIADYVNNVIRKISASTGYISTVAGNGTQGSTGDGGAATSAELSHPDGIGVDAAGNIYIADKLNHRVRKVTVSTGIISGVAGDGTDGYTGDGGAATSAEMQQPSGRISFDAAGNFYVSDGTSCVVRKVTVATGIISTVAGDGTCGYSGDGGAATSAELDNPTSALDQSGNLYIAGYADNRVRKVTVSTGIISTIAGNGTAGFSGDNGPATNAELQQPLFGAIDPAGNLYIADSGNNRIRVINLATNIISTVAGNGISGYAGNGGAATSAEFYTSGDIAIDGAGNLYIADEKNNVVRLVKVGQSILIYPTATAVGTTDSTDDPQTSIVTNIGNTNLTIPPPASGYNPSVGAYLNYDTSSTCSQLSSQSVSATFAAAAQCTIALDFAPQQVGSVITSAILTDNSLAVTGTHQTISISGTAISVATVTTISSSLSPSTYSTSVTFTAAVAAASGSELPAGTVQFSIDGTAVGGAITLSNAATATYTTSTMLKGTHSITAVFTSSSSDCTGSSATALSQVVNKATPTVTWSTPSSITYGTALGASQLDASSGGVAGTFVYSPAAGTVLQVGAGQTLSVTFTPTDTTDYNTPSAVTTTIAVVQATSTIVLSSSAASAGYGSSVTITATLPTAASGTVFFLDGGSSIGMGTISSGVATFTSSSLATGTHTLTATWAGNTDYQSATSASFTQTIVRVAVTISFTSSRNPSIYGDLVTLHATLTGTNATPTGTLTLTNGGTSIATLTLSGGSASYASRSFAAASYSLVVTYGGDANYF